jgi:integrase
VTIGAYLSDRSGILKVSTLNRRLAAIAAMHRLAGHSLDGKHPAIALVLAGIRRTYGSRQIAKRALFTEDLRRIVRKLRVHTPGGCRDRAVLLVCFGAALRRSAVLGISESDYVAPFTSPTQTDWLMRCTPRKVLRTAEQEPVVLPSAKRAA